MGIRFLCEACGKKLNIKEELAGRKGRCPKCDARIEIPRESTIEKTARGTTSISSKSNAEKQERDSESKSASTATAAVATAIDDIAEAVVQNQGGESTASGIPSLPSDSASGDVENLTSPPPPPGSRSTSTDVLQEDPDAKWFVRPSTGGQFGPADFQMMSSWLHEGRVGCDSLVWRQGWEDWQLAEDVFENEFVAEDPPSPSSEVRVGNKDSGPPGEPRAGSSAMYRHAARQRARAMGILLIIGLAVISIVLAVILVMVARGNWKNEANDGDEASGQQSLRIVPAIAPSIRVAQKSHSFEKLGAIPKRYSKTMFQKADIERASTYNC